MSADSFRRARLLSSAGRQLLGRREFLGRTGTGLSALALTSLLAGPETASLSTVADALAAIGGPEALAALHSALASAEMTPARHAAMGALERLGSEAVPGLLDLPPSCRFENRCPYAEERCKAAPPPIEAVEEDHEVSCIRWREI